MHWDQILKWYSENPNTKMSQEQIDDILHNFECGECPSKNEECHQCPIYRAYQQEITACWNRSLNPPEGGPERSEG